jgi:hypothetical protein
LDLACAGVNRAVHFVHPARPSVEVRLENGRAIARVTNGLQVPGGGTITVPNGCLDLPSTGGDLGPTLIVGATLLGGGVVASQTSRRRRRWFRRAG